MQIPEILGLIAGNGVYPLELSKGARLAGVKKIVAAAFTGETEPSLASEVDQLEWMRVGQLGRLIAFFKEAGVQQAIMAGQIAPKNLFHLRPDMRALVLLARLKQRNAESIFSGIASELERNGIKLWPATSFLEDSLAGDSLLAGPRLSRREEQDVEFAWPIAKEISRLDIGQTIVVRNGTVLAVEAFEGTNEAIRRGGALGRDGAVVIKVSKPDQDMRFDVPVVGLQTIRVAQDANIRVIAVEAGRTLLLEKKAVIAAADSSGISVIGRR